MSAGATPNEAQRAEAAVDPYGYAMSVIGSTLALVLGEELIGSMSESEARTLQELACIIASDDPASYDQFIGSPT